MHFYLLLPIIIPLYAKIYLIKMSIIFPHSNELYDVVINDCYEFLYNICSEEVKKSWEKLFKSRTQLYALDNKIYALKFYLLNPESKKILNKDIIQYTSKYIYHIENAYVNNTFIILKSISDFCLAYLALESYRYIYDSNFNENSFFFFNSNNFKNFSNFLLKYSILSQIKDAYEKSSIPILKSEVQNKYLLLKEIFDINKIFILEEKAHIDKIKRKEPQDTKKKIQNSPINHRFDNSLEKISKSVNGKKNKGKNETSFKRNNEVNTNIPEGKIITPKKLDNISRKLNKNSKQSINEKDPKTNKNKIRTYNSEKKISETDKIKDSKILNIMSQIKANTQKDFESKEESKKDKSLNNSNKKKENHSDTPDVKDEIEDLRIKMNNMNIYLKNMELDLNIKMKIMELNLNMDYLKLSESFVSVSTINSALINVEKMKCDYLDNLNRKLINGMKNLANPYNFNLWRKVSNMLLKNIFVILKNNKYELRQNKSSAIKNILISNAYKNNLYNDKFKKKIDKYESKLNSSNNNTITQNISNAADKKRAYNLVTIYKNDKPDIIASLSSDFLFFLKENGNQVNHFDEKVLNFILFDDMNIIEIEKKEEIIEEEKTNIIINEEDVFDKKYEGKVNFNHNEIILMLKNPVAFIKDDYIDIKTLFTPIYSKLEEIKELIGYNNSYVQIKDLEEKVVSISLNIKQIMLYFEDYFKTNNIDFKNVKKALMDDNISQNDKKKLKEYSEIIPVNEKIEGKIKLYQKVKDSITELNSSLKEKEIRINKIIKQIKDEIKKVAKLISIEDVFKKYKSNLLQIINEENENEYKQNKEIFSEKNINNFSITQFYTFISMSLTKENDQLCRTKRDITNYNLFVEIIQDFQEFKDDYQKDVDVKINSTL